MQQYQKWDNETYKLATVAEQKLGSFLRHPVYEATCNLLIRSTASK